MEVKVYSTEWCPWCKRVKEWMEENEIEFDDKDVSEDHQAATEMIEKTGQRAVPVTIFKDKKGEEHVVIGFNVPELEKIKEKK